MAEVTLQTSDLLDCPVKGGECPERRNIVESYFLPAEARVVLGANIKPEDPNHPRHDERKMQVSLALHKWKVEQRGCKGPKTEKCGILDAETEQESTTRLGRFLIKALRLGTK